MLQYLLLFKGQSLPETNPAMRDLHLHGDVLSPLPSLRLGFSLANKFKRNHAFYFYLSTKEELSACYS